MSAASGLRVAVVHDYLTQRGGAERVVLAMMRAFPNARLVTSVYNPDTTYPDFDRYEVETLWPDRVGAFRADPRRALPVLARAFSRHVLDGVDVVVASTSGWAHGIGGTSPKVVYCHNPARWLYQVDDYLAAKPALARAAFRTSSRRLREWDRRSADATSLYFANSSAVRARVADTYGIDAALLHPPAGLDVDGPVQVVPGLEPGFLLTVSRARGYKNTQLIAEAVERTDGARLVAVGGLPARSAGAWSARLVGLTDVSDAQLRWLYSAAAGLVAVGREDFGLTPVEGYAFGRPAAVLRAGGYVDSAAPGVATVFVEQETLPAVQAALRELLGRSWDTQAVRRHGGSFGEAAFAARLQEATASVVQTRRGLRRLGAAPRGAPRRRRSDDAQGS